MTTTPPGEAGPGPGPGLRLLAELAGEPVDALADDPRALLRALATAGRRVWDTAKDDASGDPERRRAADRSWAELRGVLERHGISAPPPAGQGHQARISPGGSG